MSAASASPDPPPNPMLQVPGQQAAPVTPDESAPMFSVPAQYQNLTQSDPFSQMGSTPLGGYTDSTYLAQQAALKYNISKQYQDILQQLGYTDDKGTFIPGRVIQQANIQAADIDHQRRMAVQEVTRRMQNQGTLFAGVRGTEQGQAEDPFVRQQGELALQVPQNLSDLYGQAQDLYSQYNLQNNQLLADAAARAAADITQHPGGTVQQTATTDASPVGGAVAGSGNPAQDVAANPSTMYAPPPSGQPGTAQEFQQGTIVPIGKEYAMAEGGEITQPTVALMGEQSTPGDRSSHEVVVPRYRLTPKQNKDLDKMLDAAGIYTAAWSRLAS